jgi:hypothetical protein
MTKDIIDDDSRAKIHGSLKSNEKAVVELGKTDENGKESNERMSMKRLACSYPNEELGSIYSRISRGLMLRDPKHWLLDAWKKNDIQITGVHGDKQSTVTIYQSSVTEFHIQSIGSS